MKKPPRKSHGTRSKQPQPQPARPIDEPALAQAAGGDGPVPPPTTWVPEQHNQTLVRDRPRRRAHR